ncbi:MAG TPA: hypothetical protein VN517_15395 [Terriglobales bacterium]|nr:hypothetical protein [Terriglobales bacterium]
MKAKSVFLAIMLLTVAGAQQQPTPNAVVYGVLSTPDGRPANSLNLEAMPLNVEINGKLPKTKTNERGEYRFENLQWWGRYKVFGEDEKAGYSAYSTGDNPLPEVEVTPEHPKAELSFTLPPKAGFIHIHLKNRRTGRAVSAMTITVVPIEKPDSHVFNDPGVFTMSCDSHGIILVPPDRNLLLHVKSDGFREWDESIGTGKPVNVPSGNRLRLDVQLDPSN